MQTFCTCDPCADLQLANPIFLRFADFKLLQVRQYLPFFIANVAYKAPMKNLYIMKNHVKRQLFRLFWDGVVQYFVEIGRFCYLQIIHKKIMQIKHKNLRICCLRTGILMKFVDFQIYGFYWIKEDAHNKLHHITIFVLFSVMSVFFARQSHTIMLYSSHIVYFHIARVVYVVILHSVYILTVLIQINILLCCTFIVHGEESTSCIFSVVVV